MRTLSTIIALVMLCATGQAAILTGVDVLSLDGVYDSPLSATIMADARSTLTTNGATVTDVPVGSFSAADLVGIDILYVGLANNAFTASQLNDIVNFVSSGGGLVAVGTERIFLSGPEWEEIANSFGVSGLGGDRAVNASPTNPASPIVNGPFGVANSYQPAATGAFSPALPAGADIVWEGVDNNPIIVTLDTPGRVVLFADTNFMKHGALDDGDNEIIWGNAFAFARDTVVPEAGTLTIWLLLGSLAMLFGWRQSRQHG